MSLARDLGPGQVVSKRVVQKADRAGPLSPAADLINLTGRRRTGEWGQGHWR